MLELKEETAGMWIRALRNLAQKNTSERFQIVHEMGKFTQCW